MLEYRLDSTVLLYYVQKGKMRTTVNGAMESYSGVCVCPCTNFAKLTLVLPTTTLMIKFFIINASLVPARERIPSFRACLQQHSLFKQELESFVRSQWTKREVEFEGQKG